VKAISANLIKINNFLIGVINNLYFALLFAKEYRSTSYEWLTV
jgi:hypothetical protein